MSKLLWARPTFFPTTEKPATARAADGREVPEGGRDVAVEVARGMVEGYQPGSRVALSAAGRSVRSEMQDWLMDYRDRGHLTPHDVTTGGQIAMIVTGGDVEAGSEISEQGLLDLEREAFLTLAATEQTRARIAHMLEFGRPLRN